MNNSLSKKIILRLLDCVPKSASDIASDIGESLETVVDQLTILVSENICEEVSPEEVSHYAARKDIEVLAVMAKEFLSNVEEHKEETEWFVRSKYYHTRIDNCLIEYVLQRFHIDSVYQTNDEKEALRRILLASPSALFHVLHTDTQVFDNMQSSHNQLDASNSTSDRFTQILRSQFQAPLLDKLIADMKIPTYGVLYATLGIRVAKINTEVSLATLHENYVEAIAGGISFLFQAGEDLPAGQVVSTDDPLAFSYQGLALMNLREYQTAIDVFDTALNAIQNPIDKAIVLNHKGIAFLRSKQYQKATECFEAGIMLDSEGDIDPLRNNKQLAEEYLARATDADNLSGPTQIRFVQGYPIPFEETLFYEFKEINGSNPVHPITKHSNEYAVAFLNREGGRIFWGIRDSDRVTIGVMLNEQQRNETRTKVSEKLGAIQPSISVEHWQLEFHNVYDVQGGIVEDLWVIELVIPPPQERDVFYTGSSDLFVKTEGGRQKLRGQQITEFILRHFQNDTETD